jgi:hypothetical protein
MSGERQARGLSIPKQIRVGSDVIGIIGTLGQLYMGYRRNLSDARYQNAQFDLQLTQFEASERAMKAHEERLEKDEFYKEAQGFATRQIELLKAGRYAESIESADSAIKLLQLAKTGESGVILQADTTEALLSQYRVSKGKALYCLGRFDEAITTFCEIPRTCLLQDAQRWNIYAFFERHRTELLPASPQARHLIHLCRIYSEAFPEDHEMTAILQFLQQNYATVVRLLTQHLQEKGAFLNVRVWKIYGDSLIKVGQSIPALGAGAPAAGEGVLTEKYLIQAILSYSNGFPVCNTLYDRLSLLLSRANAYHLLIEKLAGGTCSSEAQLPSGLASEPEAGEAKADDSVFTYTSEELNRKKLEDITVYYERDPRSVSLREFCETHGVPYPPKVLRDPPPPDTITHLSAAIAALNGDKEPVNLDKANREFHLALEDKKRELIRRRDEAEPELLGRTDEELELMAQETMAQSGHLDSQFKVALFHQNRSRLHAVANFDLAITSWERIINEGRQRHSQMYCQARAHLAKCLFNRSKTALEEAKEADRTRALPLFQEAAESSLVMRYHLARFLMASETQKSAAKVHYELVFGVSAESQTDKPPLLGPCCSAKQKSKAAYQLAFIYNAERSLVSKKKALSFFKFLVDQGYTPKAGQQDPTIFYKRLTDEIKRERGTEEPSGCNIA